MNQSLQEFKRRIRPYKQEIWREIFHANPHLIKVSKEKTAVRNLEAIIDATLRLSNEKGFHATSLRELSAAAGLSMGGLYAYIRNKDDLVELIHNHGRALAFSFLTEQLRDIDGPREKLMVAIRCYVFLCQVMRPWFHFTYMEAKSLNEKGRRQVLEAEMLSDRIFSDIIINGQETGVFRETDPRLTSALLKAMIQDWYLKGWKYRELKTDVETFADFVQDLIERYLLPEGATAPGRRNRLVRARAHVRG